MGKKYTYKIGDWVSFDKCIMVHSQEGERYAHEVGFSKRKLGQICGAIVRYLGEIRHKEWDYKKDHGFLVIRKSVIMYQVRNGMINVPFEVLEKDLMGVQFMHPPFTKKPNMPWKHVHYSESLRKHMAQIAKDQPRDSKGRFTRYDLQTNAKIAAIG